MSAVLYSFPISVWAAPPRLVLAEKNITDVTIKNVDLSKAENYSPEYLEINPEAYVPVIEKDGKRLIGSTDVSEFIDANWDGPKLTPSDPTIAKEVKYIIARVHDTDKDPNNLFFSPKDLADAQGFKKGLVIDWMKERFERLTEFKKRAPQHSELYDRKITEGKFLVGAYEHPENAGALFESTNASWEASFEFLNEVDKLIAARGGPLLFGSEYTLADAHFTAWLGRLILVRKEVVYEGRPNVEKYWVHVQQRESFKIVWPDA